MILDGENFEEILNKYQFELVKPGPLHNPVYSISVSRNNKNDICLETKAPGDATSNQINYQPGTVRLVEDEVELESRFGIKALLKGVSTHFHNIKDSDYGESRILTESSIVSSVDITFDKPSEEKYIIEWVDNVDSKYFFFPDKLEVNTNETTTITMGSTGTEFIIKKDTKEHNFGRSCVELNIDNIELIFGVLPEKSKTGKGFILYKQMPTEEIRKKIRHSISFAIGKPLIYIGHTTYDNEWYISKLKAVSPIDINGAVYGAVTQPPSPLSVKYQTGIDHEIINRLVTGIVRNYDKYNLEHVFWIYWHAECSPDLSSAINYASAIEALLHEYLHASGGKTKQTILDNKIWESLKIKFQECIDDLGINDEDDKILIGNKLNNLNQLPTSIQLKNTMENLGIKVGNLELKSWVQRNKSAHGGKIEEDQYIFSYKNTKILRLIFNRILLKMSIGSGTYIDYYTVGHPIRKLEDNIQD
jgi:hypothetical protein